MLSKTAYIRSSLCAKAISKPVAKVKIGNGSFKVPNTQLRLSGAVHRQYTKPDYQSSLALLAEEQQHWVINHGSMTGGSICYFCFVILFAYKGGRKLRELPYHFTRKKKKKGTNNYYSWEIEVYLVWAKNYKTITVLTGERTECTYYFSTHWKCKLDTSPSGLWRRAFT